MNQTKIPAVIMRGGTSKGVFFHRHHLPNIPTLRDQVILRVLGSPDAYGNQIDGLGGATSSTSKVAIISPSTHEDCDVDYLFGHVSIREATIDYSGNCGNLTAAVACFAIEEGLIKLPAQQPELDHSTPVNIWQVNTGKKIIAHVPCYKGAPQVEGNYIMAGVANSGARISVTFLDPAGAGGRGLLPTGELVTQLSIPTMGTISLTLLDAGNPTIFMRASDLGLTGCELPADINHDHTLLQRLETIRAYATVHMGLATSPAQATQERPATPKLAFVAPPTAYRTSNGQSVTADEIDITARILSMGKLHHAFTGTGAVSLAAAAAISGTLVQQMLKPERTTQGLIRIGHVAGIMDMQAEVDKVAEQWIVKAVTMGRTARRLMEGAVLVPSTLLERK